jgi:hypothetical protein
MVAPITPQNVQSPQSVTRKRRLADAMMQQGTDTSPVGHPLGALARAMQGGMAGYMSHKADTAESEGRVGAMSRLTEAMANKNMGTADYMNIASDPWMPEGASPLVGAMFKSHLDAQAPKDPIKLGAGDILLDPNTYQPKYTAPEAPVKPTSDIQNYQFGQKDPAFAAREMELKKAGAANINLNEGEQKTALFYSRGSAANEQLKTLDQYLTSPVGNMAEKFGAAGNYAMSKEYQLARRAKLDFLAVVARKDSGAQVTKQDEDMIGPAFFPGPGETSPEIIEAKRQARQMFLDSMRFSMGDKGQMLQNTPQQSAPQENTPPVFEDPNQIPEGATVEDDNGQRFIKQGGQLVPVQ